ncbi:MAG TPA: phospholipid carrier-dependent glycosyltransferase, partial [Planctomycetaceae bacterium]|nr:phospholipid carrier-dependent glycosyltransferase [Planctomycetaceae bacterium]
MALRIVTALVVLAAAAALRFTRLEQRPMHADEAVQAFKLGQVLETGRYVYDPHEYHGPALAAASLPVARAAGTEELAQLTESLLRAVPAAFGLLLVALTLLAARAIGWHAAVWAAAFTALSPTCVYYSRYYIAEPLLVCFTFAAILSLWRLLQFDSGDRRPAGGTLRSLLAAGALGSSFGLMHATKETWPLPATALVLAAVVSTRCGPRRLLSCIGSKSLAVLVAAAVIVSVTLYSWFFTNPAGPLDSLKAYWFYLQRGAAAGPAAAPHGHPWYYYFQTMLFWPAGGGLNSLEWPLIAPVLFGLCAAGASLLRSGDALNSKAPPG